MKEEVSYSMSIRQAIERYFKENDWNYTFLEDKQCLKAGVNLKCKLKETQLMIRLREDHYIVYATINVNADEDCRQQVAEYITRANYGLKWGNFEMDMRDGEIRYKVLVDCGTNCDCLPTSSVIENSIYLPAQMMQKYGNGMLAVMYGFKSPAEAIEEAEA